MMFDVMPALMRMSRAEKFKALAVSSAEPLSMLPDIPGMKAFADLGLGDHSLVNWNVVTTAGGTPEPIVRRLFEAVRQAARQPELVERMRPLGYGIVLSDSPAAAMQMIRAEAPRWQRNGGGSRRGGSNSGEGGFRPDRPPPLCRRRPVRGKNHRGPIRRRGRKGRRPCRMARRGRKRSPWRSEIQALGLQIA